ncbi:MAG: methyltransferase domain-containing protein [Deltaproteobacteria bacterium]|nr:methyltransferase domain-containing protein [Deltaproteobacteria bacterium]
MSDDLVSELYLGEDGFASTSSQRAARFDWLVSEVRGRALDIGSNQGIVSILLGRAGHDVVYVADIFDVLPGDTFDTVVLGEILEHHADPRAVWLRAARLVVPGGRLIGTTPFGLHPDRRTTFYLRNFIATIAGTGSLTHLDIRDGYIRFVVRTDREAIAVDTDAAALLAQSEATFLAIQREANSARLERNEWRERVRAEVVDAKRKNLELTRLLLVTESLLSSLRVQTTELESLRKRLHELERFTTPPSSASPAMRGFAAFLGSLQRELNTGGLGATPLEALRKTYARIRRAVTDPPTTDGKLIQSAPRYFPFVVDWPDGAMRVVPFYFCANHDGERFTDSGAAVIEQKDQVASYLTHVPAFGMSRRPESSLSIPDDEVELALSVIATGVEVSLWIIEFNGEQQIARTSWPVQDDTTVRWKPHRDCESIRLGLRLQGSGTLDSARVELRERGHQAKETERLMMLWRSLNAPKSALGSVVAAIECPTYLGPDPEVLARAAVATHPFFQSRGIDASKIVLDEGALVGKIDRGVWAYLKEAIADREYRWICPFTGDSIRSKDTFIVSEPAGYAYVLVRFESAGQVFFLIICPFRSSRIGVYFPAGEVVVSRLKLGTLVRGFRSLAVRNADRFKRYLTTTEPRKTTVPLNTLGHWGHVVLNEIEALQWLFDTGNDAKIDLWLKGEVGFFHLDALFPEIPPAKVRQTLSPDERFRCCLDENALIVNPQISSYYLGEKAGTRLVELWRREGERNGAAADIRAKLAGRFPVIWCEIRANDRLWSNQLEGLKAVVAKLEPHYPNMALVLAGWSRMLKPSAVDEKMIARETHVIKRIAEALAGTTCVPVLGVPTAEKMLWALSCHFHISIVGSGLLFALLARLPGVTLVSRYYQENELYMGDEERRVHFMYGVDRLDVLPTKFVTDDSSIENGEIRNFSVDAGALADFVQAHLAASASPLHAS